MRKWLGLLLLGGLLSGSLALGLFGLYKSFIGEGQIYVGRNVASAQYTMEMYEQIRTRQELADVFRVMGGVPIELAMSATGGYVVHIFMWQNPNGSNLQVQFMNGKVHGKGQFGLQYANK